MPPRGMAQDRSVPPRQVLAHTLPGHMVRRGHTEQVLTVMVAMVPAATTRVRVPQVVMAPVLVVPLLMGLVQVTPVLLGPTLVVRRFRTPAPMPWVPAVPVGRADSSLRPRGNPIPPELVRTRISPVLVASLVPQVFVRLLTPLRVLRLRPIQVCRRSLGPVCAGCVGNPQARGWSA